MNTNQSKVVIVGDGNVGSTTAYTILNWALCDELVLIDMNKEKAYGDALDMQHASYFMNRKTKVKAGDYSDCKDADIIIITASAPMDKNASSRLLMLAPTKKVMKSIISSIKETGFNGILLIVSNPLDIMTYYAWKLSGLPSSHVIGSGTTLDTARLNYKLSSLFDVDPSSVHGVILGEHGSSEVISYSNTFIGNKNVEDAIKDKTITESLEDIHQDNLLAGFEILKRKGNTSYGIAASVATIVKTILFNENKILPVSTLIENKYGLNNLFLSTPAVINSNGIKEVVELKLTKEELSSLHKSAEVITSFYSSLED